MVFTPESLLEQQINTFPTAVTASQQNLRTALLYRVQSTAPLRTPPAAAQVVPKPALAAHSGGARKDKGKAQDKAHW